MASTSELPIHHQRTRPVSNVEREGNVSGGARAARDVESPIDGRGRGQAGSSTSPQEGGSTDVKTPIVSSEVIIPEGISQNNSSAASRPDPLEDLRREVEDLTKKIERAAEAAEARKDKEAVIEGDSDARSQLKQQVKELNEQFVNFAFEDRLAAEIWKLKEEIEKQGSQEPPDTANVDREAPKESSVDQLKKIENAEAEALQEFLRSEKEKRVDEPKKKRVDEPKKNRVDEPKKNRVDEPEKNRVDEPEKNRVDEPEKNRVDEPEKNRVDEPEKNRVDEPEKPRRYWGRKRRPSPTFVDIENQLTPTLPESYLEIKRLLWVEAQRVQKKALEVWRDKEILFTKRVERKKSKVAELKNEVYQLVGFFSVFQGVVLTAVAQASRLTCSNQWSPISLSIVASVVTIAGVIQKLVQITEFQKTVHSEEQSLKEVIARASDLKRRAEKFRFARFFDNRQPPRQKRSQQIFYSAFVIISLIAFTVLFPVSHWRILCHGA